MGLRIRKSIKIAPGVRLNFGKKGISTSIGKRGAGITIGPTGTTAHVGIPGTGISYVKKVGTTKKSVEDKSQSTGENKKPKRNYSCLGSFLAFSGIVIVMAIHSTCEWSALTLSILVICVLYILFASITEPTLKSKACLKCLYFTKIISALCCYLEYFSYLYTIN